MANPEIRAIDRLIGYNAIREGKMSVETAILALLLYPLLQILSFNWVRFGWGFRRGVAPLAPDVEARATAVDRGLAIVAQVVLIILVVYFLRISSIPPADVGLTRSTWKSALGYGALLSLLPLSFGALGRKSFPAIQPSVEPFMLRIGRLLLASFSNEFWRAFCITALIRLDLAAWAAVLITAAVAGILKLHKTVAFAIGGLASGLLAGSLFVETHSLIAPLAMILIAALGHELFAHGARSRARADLPPLKCPKCSQPIQRNSGTTREDYVCPACKVQLRLSLKWWEYQTINFVCIPLTVLILYESGLGLAWSFALFLPLQLCVLYVTGGILQALFPQIASLQTQNDPCKSLTLRS
jgi:hypothetical protein